MYVPYFLKKNSSVGKQEQYHIFIVFKYESMIATDRSFLLTNNIRQTRVKMTQLGPNKYHVQLTDPAKRREPHTSK